MSSLSHSPMVGGRAESERLDYRPMVGAEQNPKDWIIIVVSPIKCAEFNIANQHRQSMGKLSLFYLSVSNGVVLFYKY